MSKNTKTTLMRRSALLAAVGCLTVGGGVLAIAVPANAAAPANCASGYACWWGDSGYLTSGSTKNVHYEYDIPDFQKWNYGQTTQFALGDSNDSASSVYNNGNTDTTYWYTDANEGGYHFTLPIKDGDSDLNNSTGAVGPGFNDDLSSAYFYSCLTPSLCAG